MGGIVNGRLLALCIHWILADGIRTEGSIFGYLYPTQLLTQGQWWSMFKTQLSQIEQ